MIRIRRQSKNAKQKNAINQNFTNINCLIRFPIHSNPCNYVYVFQSLISAMIQFSMENKNQRQYRRALIHFTYHIPEPL